MQEALCFADAGSVRLCTADLDVYILNGMGDGPTRCYVGDDLPVPAGTIYLGMANPTLAGWKTPDGVYLCSHCAARIMGRGCLIPRDSTPIWTDEQIEFECCLLGFAHK